jgi:hypothetical protein
MLVIKLFLTEMGISRKERQRECKEREGEREEGEKEREMCMCAIGLVSLHI